MTSADIDRDRIAQAYEHIRPHVRRTPVLEIDAAEFGLAPGALTLKLEFLQRSGSFKTRGAFLNLLTHALAAGRPVDAPAGGIAADSLAPRRVGELMFPLAQRFVERVVLVDDAAIHAAQETLWDTVRVVTEPGGATPMAALLSGAYAPAPGERVGVLLCGANTTAVDFSR